MDHNLQSILEKHLKNRIPDDSYKALLDELQHESAMNNTSSQQTLSSLKNSFCLLYQLPGKKRCQPPAIPDLPAMAEKLEQEIAAHVEECSDMAYQIRHLKTIGSVVKGGSWEAALQGDLAEIMNYVSDEMKALLGVGKEVTSFTFDEYLEFVHPDDRLHFSQAVHAAVAGRTRYDVEYRIIRPDGMMKFVRDIADTLIDEITGRPERMVGVTLDVTERKGTEAALTEANRQLRILIETMEEVFFSVDRVTNRILLMSPGSKRLFGYETEDFLNNPDLWFNLVQQEDRNIIIESEGALHRGDRVTNEYRIKHADGSVHWVEARITPTLDASGRLIRVDGINADITSRKEAELALLVSNEQLKKSNEELDRFVYSVSHDLRAPLASISGLVGYMLAESTDPVLTGDLNLIKRSIDKLDVFIIDILDYSRNARLDLSVEEVDFSVLLDDARTNLKFMSSNRDGVEIRTEMNLSRAFHSDKGRIQVVMNNLISNAIRYYNPEAATPYVQITVSTVEGGVALLVKDNGIGIDPQYHEKVFQMFYRVSDKSNGSGLGLYLVRETVHRLQGTIRLYSVPAEGTIFEIFLPDLIVD